MNRQIMTQDQAWELNYNTVMKFMLVNKRRPSKHRPEEHMMLNWIKYTKKRLAKNLLPADRVKKFELLQTVADRYRRVNQHMYLWTGDE